MKISNKMAVLMLVIVLMFGAGVSWYVMSARQNAVRIFDEEKTEKSRALDEVLKLEGRMLYLFVFDYTFWDEMVEFVKIQDGAWAKDNLEVSLSTYRANAAWVFNLKGEMVYEIDDLGWQGDGRKLPVPEGALQNLFLRDNRFCHFYTKIPKGIMEVRGATIHPSADKNRKTAPQGYFLAGRVLDKDYVESMSEYFGGASFDIINSQADVPDPSQEIKNGMITFFRPLKGTDGEIVAYIRVMIKSPFVARVRDLSKNMLITMITFAFIVTGTLFFFILRWVTMPLKRVARALEKEDAGEVMPLLKRWDEFGRMAGLIDNFFRQRKMLVAEIDRRKKMEEELSAKLAQLRQFKDIAVGREVKMIELKKEVNKLSKDLGRSEPYDASF